MVRYALDVLHRVAGIRDAVFEDECGDAVVGQPLGDLRAFIVPGQRIEAAAGADEDGRAGLGAGSGEIGDDDGIDDVEHHLVYLVPDGGHVVEHHFLVGPGLAAGGFAGIETDG